MHSHGFYRDQTQDKAKIYNGRIVCRLQTETPIFIGAGKAAQDNQGINQAQPIDNYRLNERIAIPATSLRGVISSMAEAASNSALRVLDDGMLSYRQKIGKTPTALGMIIKKEGQWRLIPLTLPTLKERNGDYALPKEYSTMFPDGKAKLKVYLENAFTNSTEKTTWTQKNSKVYYIELDDKHKMDAEKLVAPNSDYLRKPSDKPKFVIGQRAINPEVYERPNPKSTPGILRILGHKTNRTDIPSTKKHEIFIPIPDGYENNGQLNYNEFIDKEPSFLIPNEVVSRFEELANQRTDSQNDILSFENWLPYHPKGMQRNTDHTLSLHEGDLVYFSPNINQNDIVAEIAFSSIWRGRVEEPQGVAANVQRFFPRELWPFNKDRTHISPAELLFGFTEINADGDKNENDNLAFAGKVRVSAGLGLFAENKIDTELLDEEITLKALSSPKLPSPALYFRSKSSTNKYISKETLNPEQHEANGRKYYLHALRKQNDPDLVQQLNSNGTTTDGTIKLPWETQPNPENDRLQLKVKIKPIKSGQAFYLHLDFNNLTEWELGLLCYTLRPTESFRHRIGMGKPIGLGSVKIDVVALLTIDRKQRYTKDPLESYRYNQHNWVNQAYLKEMNDMGYKITETSNPLQPTDLRKKFTDTMSYDIYRALDLLGNPHNIKHPVHYPQVENQNIEEENFKWFVTNDNPNAETNTLEAINEKSECIPTLKRHRIKK